MSHEGLKNEIEPSEEILRLEFKAMNRYFTVAGVTKDERPEWITENGAALRKVAENDSEFLALYAENENATTKEFESKLLEYL